MVDCLHQLAVIGKVQSVLPCKRDRLKIELPFEYLRCLSDIEVRTVGRVHDQVVIDHLDGVLYRNAQRCPAEYRGILNHLRNLRRQNQRTCAVVNGEHGRCFRQGMQSAHHALLSGRTAFHNGVQLCDPSLFRRFPNGIVIRRTCHHDQFRHTFALFKGTHCHADDRGITQRKQNLIFSLHPCGISGAHENGRGICYRTHSFLLFDSKRALIFSETSTLFAAPVQSPPVGQA